MALPYYIGRL